MVTKPFRAALVHTVYTVSYGGANGGGINFSIKSRDEGAAVAIINGEATLTCTEACGLVFGFHLTTPQEQRQERRANIKRRILYIGVSYPFVGVSGVIASHTEGVVSILAIAASAIFSLFSLAQVVMLFKKPARYRLFRRQTNPVTPRTHGSESIDHTAKLY